MGNIQNTLLSISITAGATFTFAVLLILISYAVFKIRSTDYSDQSGWVNFSRPILGILLIILFTVGLLTAIFFTFIYLDM